LIEQLKKKAILPLFQFNALRLSFLKESFKILDHQKEETCS